MPATPSDTRRLRARRALAGLAVACTAVGLGACSTPAPSQGDLSEALVSSGLSKEVADCTASAFTDSLTKSELAELTERGAGGAPVDDPKRDDDSYDKLQKALVACRDLQAEAAPSTTTTAAPAEGEGAGDTSSTIANGTNGAELNPESTTTAAP
ncbi:MAG TPA: hypothetical protein VNS19_15385 [Acidimicrobiales bacterium]|nr:hypothetical protein [Acidimicrobiales bacterium]